MATTAQLRVSPDEAGRLMKMATTASVAVAVTLIAIKVTAWLLTDSISILSSLIDSLMDVLASVVNLLAVRQALMPPDREHRFGHGKAEPLAGLAQSAFIAGSAALLTVEAVRRLFLPQPVSHVEVGIGVMVVSIVLTVGLVALQRYVVRRTASTAVGADALHYQSDILINGSVIVSLSLSHWFGWHLADPVFAIAIAAYLVRGAWVISRRSLDVLMDREFPDAERARIKEIALGHAEVTGMHDLRTRQAGIRQFIQLHLEMDGDMRLGRAHDIADEVEAWIRDAYPGAEVIIHQDPEGLVENHPGLGE
ncbi:MAG: cation diffusion facilitator family transporter [Alphaproteobacteria bacterium]